MKKIIHNLRQQPEDVRRHVLHIATLVFGLLLIVSWVYSLSRNINDVSISANAVEGLNANNLLENSPEIPQW